MPKTSILPMRVSVSMRSSNSPGDFGEASTV
jgi:hypothetical protein